MASARTRSNQSVRKNTSNGRGRSKQTASKGSRRAKLCYDGIDPKNKRKSPAVRNDSEDTILPPLRRSKMVANARDLQRNYSIAAWMVRRHLDYCSTFDFSSREPDGDFNDALAAKMATWSMAANCDAAGRHSLSKIIRLLESRAILDGDCGLMLVEDGTLQGIEGDRVRDPEKKEKGQTWVHGVRTTKGGRAIEYAVHSREGTAWKLDQVVPAEDMLMRGYYDRFDQIRGISPLSTALNPLRDTYENIDLALAKAKIAQLFAFKITRKASEGFPAPCDADSDSDSDTERRKYQWELNRPTLLDLDPGDDAEMIESQHPSGNFMPFMEQAISLALKALDIPYSFFSENFTNFFGSRGAWLHYERSCIEKRAALQAILNAVTRWRISLWVLDGELTLPSGKTVDDLFFQWVPKGLPWWRPQEEISSSLMAIGAGLDNPQRICLERDRGDVFDNIDATAEVVKYAKEKHGMTLSFTSPAAPIQVVNPEDLK